MLKLKPTYNDLDLKLNNQINHKINQLKIDIKSREPQRRMLMTEDSKKEITERITKNLLDIQLLRLIDVDSMWGYKIKKTFQKQLGINLRHGALYPTLNTLEQSGLLSSQIQKQNGRERKTYSLTTKGRQYLLSYYTVLEDQLKTKSNKQN